MSMGPNSFNGIGVLIGGAASCLVGLPVLAGLGLAWAANKVQPRSFMPSLWLILGHLVLFGLAIYIADDRHLIGPRTPGWVDGLGFVWFFAYIAATVIVIRRTRRQPGTPP